MRKRQAKNLEYTNFRSVLKRIRLFLSNILFIYKMSTAFIFLGFIISCYSFQSLNEKITNSLYKKLAQNLNFKLENVFLEGHNRVSSEEIAKNLNIKLGTPILEIPINKIKNNIEKIKWIDKVIIERRLPNTLYINITERVPVAVWQIKGKLYLVDIKGKIISLSTAEEAEKYIVLIGEGAAHKVDSLLKFLKKDLKLFQKVISASRISERRWNINLEDDIEIKLPEKNEQEAWEYICTIYEREELLKRSISIDLRVPNKIYLNGLKQDYQPDTLYDK